MTRSSRAPGHTAVPVPPLVPEAGGWGWEAAAALVAVAVYLPTLGHGWVYDDQMEVVRNALIRSFARLPEVFTTTAWAGSGMETYLYRPLAMVTYMVNHAVSGADPWSYHLVNVLLHGAATLLVVRLARAWGLPAAAAGITGLVFAAHPVHVEAVAPVFGRKDLLATILVLGMALAHRRAVSGAGARRWAWGAPLLYLGAMLSKEVGIVGIALVAAQDAFLEPDRRAFLGRRSVPVLYAAYAGAAALFLALRTAATGGLGIPDTAFWDNPLVEAGPGVRLATGLVVAAKGVGLLLLPVGQSPDWSYDAIPVVASAADARLWAALGGAAALGAAHALPRVRRSVLPLAVAWYGISLLPTANLLVVSGTIFAERLLYLPSVAFALAAGAALAGVTARPPRSTTWPAWAAPAAVGAAVALPLAGGTVAYARHWTDDVALFRRAVEAVPRSTKAQHKLGEELLRAGDVAGALRHLERALEIAPDNVFAAQTLAQARAEALRRWPLPEEAPAPGTCLGAGPSPDDADVLYALAVGWRERGNAAGTEACLVAAIGADPAHATALTDLGALRHAAGDAADAERLLVRAVEARPMLAPAWFNLGAVRLQAGDGAGAREALTRFLEIAGTRAYPDEVAWARSVVGATEAPR